ncbi:hypothetical protein [Bradyrhizobium brasilense]|nr:hypothetical protein [Bradyrhizobium brasilense]
MARKLRQRGFAGIALGDSRIPKMSFGSCAIPSLNAEFSGLPLQ